MVDVEAEDLIPLDELPRQPWMPRKNGKVVSARQIRRWREPGIKGARLEAVKVGRYFATTKRTVLVFWERLAMPASAARAPTPSQQRRAQAHAKAILHKHGI